jgi:hypothetical protein
MAFAAASARPASSRFIRPGSASLWLPPRPFPALLWLAQRPAAGSAGLRAGWSADGAASPTRGRAARDGGATSTALPRLDLELRLLFSRCPLAPDEDFFVALRIELGRRAWSLEHAIGAPRPAWSAAPGDESDLEKRRARLATEVNLGLAIVESAPVRSPRPVRNVLLVRHAGLIGRCLRDLLAHPEAGSLAEELQRVLDALERRW